MNNECACGSANEVAKQEETAATVVKEESRRTYMPAVDVVDTDSETMLFADMPGVAPDSIDITLEKNTLTVKGKAEKEEYEG
ncbi:MAG: Hsp20 family protein, partial [Planctomycetes bacterium]|nr:Hsp20 family protein [Planctomycetota bacterium]